MTAMSRNLVIEQGTSWNTSWHVQVDGVDLNPGAGWQARAQVRAFKTSAIVLYQFICTVVGSIVTLSVLPDDSSAWTWINGVYDVEIFNNSVPSMVVRVVEGSIAVDAEVTR